MNDHQESDINDPEEFVIGVTEISPERFETYYFGSTPQVYKAKDPMNFSKISTKTINNRLDYANVRCPFCRTLMCEVSEEDDDKIIKSYASRVRGYEQLCHDCGKELCETYGKEYETTCHNGRYLEMGVHRSGIYVHKSITKMFNKILKNMGCKAKGKEKCEILCKTMYEDSEGHIYYHFLKLCHGWLY